MIFTKGYTFTKVKTSHGPDMYVSRFGRLVKVVQCNPQVELSEAYTSDLIQQIESKALRRLRHSSRKDNIKVDLGLEDPKSTPRGTKKNSA